MNNAASKVTVVGSGISGAVCACTLARNGISVTLFDSARGPGGRMSQRRETSEDGNEMLFDHGAPFFTVTNNDVLALVREWESGGLVAEWKVNLGSFDRVSKKFVNIQQDGMNKKYVGVPGMNSICKALCHQPDLTFAPDLAVKLEEIPVNPCFALMLAFSKPLSPIPVKGFSFQDSEVLSWAHCDSSKPGRSAHSERWVLHSTADYARTVIAQTGLQKPSEATLKKVAEEMFQEFQGTGLSIPLPIFRKAHRWGSAFPAASIAKEERCLWDVKKRLAICGDFCVSPNVEGAILSGLAAASKLTEILSCL
ncbi:fad/nad(p)-binding oxidoreductase family protein [Citrus sinensis]|uniref:Fad/nad(P)-binding oxidoreductase family protein n=1 Tax=Citrus sinensis TaxID=2711 RepID=A0ACB8M264_CITSI|nr:fad/nad(p)-binding oxidoreductase family protein [Citrus sinensis]